MSSFLFDDWQGLLRVLIVGVLSYAALIIMLRISGKRTLSKMNAFDLIVTIALGSTLSPVILDNKIALAEGVLALALLIFLQFIVTWWSVRSRAISGLIRAEPTLVAHQGEFCRGAMQDMRLTEGELMQALREQGLFDISQARSVVMETNGELSVIKSL